MEVTKLAQEAAERLLEMEKISKTFPGVKALDDVKFDLKKGEVHVLLGENGAGKSTLIKILAGVHKPDCGTIKIHGDPVMNYNPHQAQEMGISVIYQELNLVPYLTVAENIFLGDEPLLPGTGFIDWKTLNQKAATVLTSIGSDINCKTVVEKLSIAQQQIVEIAKAVSKNAQIIVMDEPTSSLAETEIANLFNLIRRLRGQGAGIIYIGHRMEEVFEIGDRSTVYRDGRYIGTKNIHEVDTDELIRMIVGRELTEQYPYTPRQFGETVLKVENLNSGNKLHNINLQLRAGEILGISGMLGAGRTELAQTIFGALPYDSGTIIINDHPVKIKKPQDAISHGIGLLPEDRKNQGLSLIMSIKNNITLASLKRFLNGRLINTRQEESSAMSYVERIPIKTSSIMAEAQSLSGGNQQKVVLAKWLCSEAKIVIFDEPTRGIDVGAKVEIYKLMTELAQNGGAIIMISSELPEVLGMSDRILVMREGRIVKEMSRAEATQEKIHQASVSSQIN